MPARRRFGLIHNPVSGIRNSDDNLAYIQEVFQEDGVLLDVRFTEPGYDPAEAVNDFIAAGAEAVIASGGDGTVAEVAGALAETETPLGVIPRGTGNAFALSLGILPLLSTACRVILDGDMRRVDTATCNGRHMVLLAAVGYEAEVVKRAGRELKQKYGPFAYFASGLQQLSEQGRFRTTVEIGAVRREFDAAAITIANAAPPTSMLAQGLGTPILDDGFLDMTIVRPVAGAAILDLLADLFVAGIADSPVTRDDVRSGLVRQIRISTDPPQTVAVDGEIIGETPVEIECVPSSLSVFAPPPKADE
jgi:YegS/Rv2252/BmrU family lipid kinase